MFSLVAHKESVLYYDYYAKDDCIFCGSEDKKVLLFGVKVLKKKIIFKKKF